jgi:hypothetical protein
MQIEGQTGWHRFLLWETTTPAGKEVELHLDDHHEVSPSPPILVMQQSREIVISPADNTHMLHVWYIYLHLP